MLDVATQVALTQLHFQGKNAYRFSDLQIPTNTYNILCKLNHFLVILLSARYVYASSWTYQNTCIAVKAFVIRKIFFFIIHQFYLKQRCSNQGP